jgi:protein-tyrosine phosphatase
MSGIVSSSLAPFSICIIIILTSIVIWHETLAGSNSEPAVIIMLSPTHDPHPTVPGVMFEKCFPYFPKDENSEPLIINETCKLGDEFKATIRFVSQEPQLPSTDLEIRKFAMSVDGQDGEKPIWHFLYPSWPDFGALEESDLSSLMLLMSLSREKNTKSDNPRVIHCSAGVGRTGTFVALEFLIGELQRGAWQGWDKPNSSENDPIFNTVNRLRMQRRTMVQSAEQYAFIYEVLRKMWTEKYGSAPEPDVH